MSHTLWLHKPGPIADVDVRAISHREAERSENNSVSHRELYWNHTKQKKLHMTHTLYWNTVKTRIKDREQESAYRCLHSRPLRGKIKNGCALTWEERRAVLSAWARRHRPNGGFAYEEDSAQVPLMEDRKGLRPAYRCASAGSGNDKQNNKTSPEMPEILQNSDSQLTKSQWLFSTCDVCFGLIVINE